MVDSSSFIHNYIAHVLKKTLHLPKYIIIPVRNFNLRHSISISAEICCLFQDYWCINYTGINNNLYRQEN